MIADGRFTSAQLRARMRELDYDDLAARAFDAVMNDNSGELTAVLDAMTSDDLHHLVGKAEALGRVARAEWLLRVQRPAGER